MTLFRSGFRARHILQSIVAAASIAGAAQAAPLPDTCDAIPAFEIAERYYFNDLHRAVMEKIDAWRNSEDGGNATTSADEEAINAIAGEVAEKHGMNSTAYAIVDADRADVILHSDTEDKPDLEAGGKAFAVLRKSAKSRQEIDHLAALLPQNLPSGDGKKLQKRRLDLIKEVLARHQAAFGYDVRQISMLKRIADDSLTDAGASAELESVSREMESIAQAVGSARGLYFARTLQLRALAAADKKHEAKALAAELWPELRARIEHTHRRVVENRSGRAFSEECWNDKGTFDLVSESLGDAADDERLATMDMVTFFEPALHDVQGWYLYPELLKVKDEDPAFYRELARYEWGNEVTFALGAASSLESVSLPAQAREYLDDAYRWSAVDGEPTPDRFEVLLATANFEWEYGNSSRTDALIAEADGVAARLGDQISDGLKADLFLLKASIADGRLQDDVAVAMLESAVAIAAADSRGLYDEGSAVGRVAETIDRLFLQHLQGRFCQTCGSDLGKALKVWWARRSRTDFEFDAAGKMLTLAVHLSDLPLIDATLHAEAARAIEKGLEPAERETLAGFIESGLEPDEALKLTLLGAMVAATVEGLDRGIVYDLLREPDLDAKREIARAIAEDQWAFVLEFSAIADGLAELDTLTRMLSAAGYPLSARMMTENIISFTRQETEEGAKVMQGSALLQSARVLGAAYARMATYAFEDGDWQAADTHATTAMKLMTDRLGQEWRTGSERAILLYRTFQPAMKRAAQIRFLLAATEDAEAALPGIKERVFADLQLAMLGETAFANQAAFQSRILKNAEVRQALARRDAAIDSLGLIETMHEEAPARAEESYPQRHAEAVNQVKAATDAFERLFPQMAEFATLQTVPLARAQQALAPDEALLVIHAGTNNLYGFTLRSSGEPELYVSSVAADELSAEISQLRRDASQPGSFDLANAELLYQQLLAPVSASLDGVAHLIVVADGPVLGIPWGALSTGDAGGILDGAADNALRGAEPIDQTASEATIDWAAVPWLIRKMPVSVIPGVATLASRNTDVDRSKASRPFLGVGNPSLGGSKEVADLDVGALYKRGGGLDAAVLASLRPLPETAAELKALSSALGGSPDDLLLAAAATEDRLGAVRLDDYRVVAFATHGILAGEIAGYSEPGLVMTREAGAAGDGYLSLSEIMALKFDADLVILSACNTGGADGRPRAEWMSGLARGFISAGARQLLVTLWSIPSDPTVRLMTGMAAAHKAAPGSGWARAMQSSVLAMIDKPQGAYDSHPASWAGFVILGSGAMSGP